MSSEVPSSVATLRGRIEQPAEAHTAFLRGLIGRILVRRPLDLPDLLLRPCLVLAQSRRGRGGGGAWATRRTATPTLLYICVPAPLFFNLWVRPCSQQATTDGKHTIRSNLFNPRHHNRLLIGARARATNHL